MGAEAALSAQSHVAIVHFPALHAQCAQPLPVLPAGHVMQFFGVIPLQSVAATHSGFAPSAGAALVALSVGVAGVVTLDVSAGAAGAAGEAGGELPHAATARRSTVTRTWR